jgi:O-antigen/teichoic acid export membrane protein
MSGFKRNLGVVTLASAASFAVSLGLTPVMTRLYAPADYGVFAVVNNLATFIATLALMSLPNALPIERRPARRARVARAIVHLGSLAFGLSAVVVVSSLVARRGGAAAHGSAVILPVLVAAIAVHRLAQSWAVADGRFGTMAASRIAHPVVAKLGAIGSAVSVGPHPVALLAFETLGYAVQARIMLRARWRASLSLRRPLSRARWRVTTAVVRAHRDTTLYGHASTLLTLGEVMAESLIIAQCFSVREAGLFALALSMVALPVQLVALATASVVYHRFIETARVDPSALPRTVLRTALGYLAIGLPVYGIVFWKGADLFALALGGAWQESGALASTLAVPLLLRFALTPVTSVFRVASRQHAALLVDATLLPVAIGAFLVCSVHQPLPTAAACLAVGLSVHHLVLLVGCLAAARRVPTASIAEATACASS